MFLGNQTEVNKLLQNTSVLVHTDRKSALDSLELNEIAIPSTLPINMIVAVRPGADKLPNEIFWLGMFYLNILLLFLTII